MESLELKKFLKDIGNSVHSMNTIAVALSLLPNRNVTIPEGLEISWNPKDLEYSKIMSRNYSERSSYVYAAESLFEYLDNISKNAFWNYPEHNFKGEDKKAIKVYKFLNSTPGITETMAVLCELLSHWRNRIVHLSVSNAELSSNKKEVLKNEKDEIYSNFHHFDILIALENFDNKKITLKDVSTLLTIAIKSARLIDRYYFSGISERDIDTLHKDFLKNVHLKKIINQNESKKKERQIEKWVSVNYPYLTEEKSKEILEKLKTSP